MALNEGRNSESERLKEREKIVRCRKKQRDRKRQG